VCGRLHCQHTRHVCRSANFFATTKPLPPGPDQRPCPHLPLCTEGACDTSGDTPCSAAHYRHRLKRGDETDREPNSKYARLRVFREADANT
jgi:hypothetical protein